MTTWLQKNDVWLRYLVPVVVVLALAWFNGRLDAAAKLAAKLEVAEAIITNDLATVKDVKAIVDEQSPYVKDKAGIEARLKSIEAVLVEIRQDLREARKR